MQPNDPNKFTESAWNAIVQAVELTKQQQQQQIESEHLLLALLNAEGLANSILQRLNINPQQLRDKVEALVRRNPKITGGDGQVYIGNSLDKLLDRAEQYRQELKDDFIAVEHLVLAYTQDDRCGKKLLQEFGVSGDRKLKEIIQQIRGSQTVKSRNAEANYEALEKYGRDLTRQAAEGKLDPVIGRDDEIRRMIQILSRRTKNNPVLIGEPGVGKTAIVEGLARRVISGMCPNLCKIGG
jgi:ATP-dependent Clp protease ATP-binding subunit ClpB